MASSSNSQSEVNPPSPGISDEKSSLCTMKITKGENSANEKDNRNSQKHNVKVSSRKRDEPEDEAERRNENSNNLASFNTLDDDCLGNILDFVGKKSYSIFGRVNKTCHEMFCSKGLPKETYLFGYGSLHIIQQRRGWKYSGIAKGVFYFNRRDILEWMFTDESIDSDFRLKCLCYDTIQESRKDILRQVFRRANEEQLEYLRDCNKGFDLCYRAAELGKLEYLKLLRKNECKLDGHIWSIVKEQGHEHILDYLRNNGYPTEWQN